MNTPNHKKTLAKAKQLQEEGVPFVLATVVRRRSPSSANPGDKAVILQDGIAEGWIGGGCAQPIAISQAKKALSTGEPILVRITPDGSEQEEEGVTEFKMTCHSGGTLDIFIDPVIPPPSLLVVGGSPVAVTLAALAESVGFSVIACSPDASRDMFPNVSFLTSFDPSETARLSPMFAAVATQGKRDEAGLEAALASGASYIALVASERKAAKLKEYLKERGHSPKRIDAIRSPAGVEIGAETPQEIALSVLSGIVKARRTENIPVPSHSQADKKPQKSGEPAPTETKKLDSQSTDPICQMAVDVESAEHISTYNGAIFLFCGAGCKKAFDQNPEIYAASSVER